MGNALQDAAADTKRRQIFLSNHQNPPLNTIPSPSTSNLSHNRQPTPTTESMTGNCCKIVKETRDGRVQEVEIKLSEWVFNAIEHQEVLTLYR